MKYVLSVNFKRSKALNYRSEFTAILFSNGRSNKTKEAQHRNRVGSSPGLQVVLREFFSSNVMNSAVPTIDDQDYFAIDQNCRFKIRFCSLEDDGGLPPAMAVRRFFPRHQSQF